MTLSHSRPVSSRGAAGAIPISEILAFCQLVGIANREERVKYLGIVQTLDQICLDHWAAATAK